LQYLVYGLTAWLLCFNAYFLFVDSISLWHGLLTIVISYLSHFCLKQMIKCWELQLPAEASDYYVDVLVINMIVALFDPLTHKIW
jgi:hypothetical protein